MKKTIKPIKKMKTGGSSSDCKFPLCKSYEGATFVGCKPCGASVKGGLIGSIGGTLAVAGKIISDKVKQGKAVKAEAKNIRAANPDMTKKESRKAARDKINNPTPKQKKGGSVKSKKK